MESVEEEKKAIQAGESEELSADEEDEEDKAEDEMIKQNIGSADEWLAVFGKMKAKKGEDMVSLVA